MGNDIAGTGYSNIVENMTTYADTRSGKDLASSHSDHTTSH